MTTASLSLAQALGVACLLNGPLLCGSGPDSHWDDFVKRHASTLWACDFLSVKSARLTGFVDLYYLLFFIHVGSRRAFVAWITTNPTGE